MSAGGGAVAGRGPERAVLWAVLGCASLTVVIMLAIVVVLGREVAQFVALPDPIGFELRPLLVGTAVTTAVGLLVAVPLGVLAAVYLAEFASPRRRELLEPSLEIVAGVPTVVWGFFAVVVLTPALQSIVPGLARHNALSAGIVIGVMIAPLLGSRSAVAIRAVPRALREGAWALGAGEAQTIFTIVLPTAAPGIAAAIVLALGRAIGETMIVTMAAGRWPSSSFDLRAPVETLSTHLVDVSFVDASSSPLADRSVFVVAAVLVALSLAARLLAGVLGRAEGER